MAVPDPTYPNAGSGMYRENNRLVVGTSGELILGTTNAVIMTSTEIRLGSAGRITMGSSDVAILDASGLTFGTSGGSINKVTAGTTTANLGPYGISTVSITSGASQLYNLTSPPLAGIRKTIICTLADTTDTVTIFSGTAVGMNNTGTAGSLNKYIFKASGVLELFSNTTSNWIILTPNISTVGYSTS